MIIHGVSAVWR